MTGEDYIEWRANLAAVMKRRRWRRLFLTGGTGFFGKWLLECFLVSAPDDLEILMLTRSASAFASRCPRFVRDPRISLLEGDVRSFDFPGGEFDAVIHAASPVSVRLERENPDEMYSVIVDGTRRVLEFAERKGVARLLFVSSGAVYGEAHAEMERFREDRPCSPITAYGKGKLQAELLALKSAIPAVIARCFAFVGAGLPLDAHFAVGNFIADCLAGRPITIKGDGRPWRSYLYAGELAEWLWRLLLTAPDGTVCNVGGDRAVNLVGLAGLVRAAAGARCPVRILHGHERGAGVDSYLPDLRRAACLGLISRIPLEQALSRTLRELTG